jgi:hypothetical protein
MGRICACRVWVGKPEERRAVGKPRPRWEDIKMDLREVGGGGRDWINLALVRNRLCAVINSVMNLRVE